MPIPTELVGSLPRPVYLQQAYADFNSGKITREEFVQAQDKAVEDSLTRLIKTGETYLTDGDQRVSSFFTYPVVDILGGKGLANSVVEDGIRFPYDDGHHRQIPRIVKGPFRYSTFAWQMFKQNAALSKGHPMKQAVISPSMIYLQYPLNEEVPGYSKEQFMADVVNECEKDIRGCFAAGVKRVSIDFTEGRLALKNDPQYPWTAASLLDTFIDLNNQVLDRFTPAERINIGVHTCPGGDSGSYHSLDVPYYSLLPSLFKINAGYFLMQLASHAPDIRTSVYQEIGKHIRKDANGVKQVAFIGVIDPGNPTVETPEEVCESLVEAGKYIPADQLGATDDCGFNPFINEVKPKYGGDSDFVRDIVFEKIAARVKGAKMASERLHI
ncbi:hypothetical protein GYMLUDRAFT_99348 [Collybiopsis luxurians FD-317 M1]|uniref:Cobalamin-independent methionine synthase MetE C-terminal/archaeal domain-containing protein n=1 Tax=Collybiopsis luxurians FD-317 M1 TaxID=944289 RepID=A0A0D0C1F6_9AGAR|nr:hypothetical protein GYMLUDRAFT_99348 [Collybiopsis luxurians FD-317 M1]